ncbi:methyl-accepting chemotaxis protein [Marinobacter fonticola]|uniref:methyl-accepting chemotaxis protein n=1 Tax=Marinobacter fonticola TaxID=2603215 RepID=UPI0011E88226|nr:methyl-accepting chemotaxis protein [Marinobacter fonticola]
MQLGQRINNINVGFKLAGGFAVLVVLAIIISVTGAMALQSYADRSLIVAGASAIESRLLDARTDEKNFQIRRENKYVDRAIELADQAATRAEKLNDVLVVPADNERVRTIVSNVDSYKALLDEYRDSIEADSQTIAAIENNLLKVARKAVETAVELQNVQMERMDADYSESMTLIVGAAIAAVLIATVLGWILTRHITQPIRQTVEIANKVASGDLTVDASSNRTDEFGQLLSAFDTMITSLRALIGEISTGSNSIASASEEMSIVTHQTSAAVNNQKDKTDQVATAMNEMVATVSEVAKSAEAAFESANTATDRSTQGESAVRETLSYVSELKQQIDNVMGQLNSLQSETHNIGSILDVIKAVAEQTNLLALNAAIEAARAGEHGRGFAVVADEVRSLARRTQSSAGEIESLINNLVASAESSSTSMERSTSLAERTLQSAETTQEIIRDVVQSVEDIRQYNSQIATAAEQQASVAEDINRNVTDIREEGDQTASATEQVSASSNELARLAGGLKNQVARFRT